MSVWRNDFIKVNKYSRPAFKLLSVKKIILHYTANPNAPAKNHVTYFGKTMIEQNEKLPANKRRYASAHLFTDKNEAVCIIPLDEVAYHANDMACKIPELLATASFYKGGNANLTTIGIEMCIESDGSIHPDTLKRTEDVVVELLKMYRLDAQKDVLTHHQVTGKICPLPWVRSPQQFTDFKNRVAAKMNSKPAPPTQQEKLMWGKTVFKKGQIGKITVLKPINLWKRDENNKLHFVRILNVGDEYRVYNYDELHGGQYDVGDRHYVTKIPEHILYQTPSKKLLQQAKEIYG